jgi:hypothetical protein
MKDSKVGHMDLLVRQGSELGMSRRRSSERGKALQFFPGS